MTPWLRRAAVSAAAVAIFFLLPASSQAQGCYYDVAVYADASVAGNDVYTYGAGYDGSYCPYCYHTYKITPYLIPASGGYYSEEFEGLEGGLNVTVGVGTAQYGAYFEVNCSCAGWVGPISYAGEVQVGQPPPVPSGETTSTSNWGSGDNVRWCLSSGGKVQSRHHPAC